MTNVNSNALGQVCFGFGCDFSSFSENMPGSETQKKQAHKESDTFFATLLRLQTNISQRKRWRRSGILCKPLCWGDLGVQGLGFSFRVTFGFRPLLVNANFFLQYWFHTSFL